MNFVLKPWQLLLLILAGWINRDQQDAIEYLLTENQVLRERELCTIISRIGLTSNHPVLSLEFLPARLPIITLGFPRGRFNQLPHGVLKVRHGHRVPVLWV